MGWGASISAFVLLNVMKPEGTGIDTTRHTTHDSCFLYRIYKGTVEGDSNNCRGKVGKVIPQKRDQIKRVNLVSRSRMLLGCPKG